MSSLASAQTLDRSVVASAGGLQTNASASVQFTIGETVVGQFSASNTLLTQGFNQAKMDTSSISIGNLAFQEVFTLFPNPASTLLSITSNISADALIYDVTGKQVLTTISVLPNQNNTLNVSTLATGVYFVHCLDENQNRYVAKWVKE